MKFAPEYKLIHMQLTTDGKFKLIDGIFTTDEARSVLFQLFEHKINFHNREIFSAQERFGISSTTSRKRVEELKAAKENIRQILIDVGNEKAIWKIESTIVINLIDTK